MDAQEFGARGETIAADYIKRLGWRILGRNIRVGHGELDITAMDGSDLVILEVRTRRVGKLMPAETSVGPMKLRTLIRTARKYVEKISYSGDWRIDVLAVTEDDAGHLDIELFSDVTMGMSGSFMG
ncbi:MAG: YraN family protein [Synergistaceae bacterium]|jgi:putative endonuclease|nr:YraN family protein [Synergistaceae bacterium]